MFTDNEKIIGYEIEIFGSSLDGSKLDTALNIIKDSSWNDEQKGELFETIVDRLELERNIEETEYRLKRMEHHLYYLNKRLLAYYDKLSNAVETAPAESEAD